MVGPETGQEHLGRGVHPGKGMGPDIGALAHEGLVGLGVVDARNGPGDLHAVVAVGPGKTGESYVPGGSEVMDSGPSGGEVELLGVKVHLGHVLRRVLAAGREPGGMLSEFSRSQIPRSGK